ncbi:F-box/FBD/LRR-repeat protein At1g13570-like [Rutidosis leptorrhynchoides]|uniref:F-box/FBD/LRR-repeat protein At1g13570-like n=1 Tax=Rutidosis leptorrhynchoides TaxID=125765 RepID=UPI003A9A4DA9
MEPAPGKHNESKSACEDIISRMPEDVISHILDRLPIQYAVMTSILSRNWRFKWTLLSHVVFDSNFTKNLLELKGENWCDEVNISRILLHLKGSITKFKLYIPRGTVLDVTEIDHWVMLLSRKGIKEFILINRRIEPITLSSNFFSCVNLEHLNLSNCSLNPTPSFCGFPYLLYVSFYDVAFVNGSFGEFISQCPLFEFLDVHSFDYDSIQKLKSVEIAKLKNLKCFFFPLCMLDTTELTSSLVFHVLGHLSKLQTLYLDICNCKFIRDSGTENWVRTSLSRLKTLGINPIDFGSDTMLSFVIDMIWGSPELETLEIIGAYIDSVSQPALCASVFNRISTAQLQLRFMKFYYFRGSENAIYLIKNLLACSPLLKEIVIHPNDCTIFSSHEKLMDAKKLLKLQLGSSAAEVNIIWTKFDY